MKFYSKLFISAVIFLSACRTSGINTVWKTKQAVLPYKKILVAAIVPGINDTTRMKMEETVVKELTTLGYQPVSNVKKFGFNGLSEMGEDEVYMALCDAGIDAVLTVAITDSQMDKDLEKGAGKKYINAYFYEYMWNYRRLKNIQETAGKPALELILFDLRTLESVCVINQRKAHYIKNSVSEKTIAAFIKKLRREEIILQQPIQVQSPKAF